MVEGITAHMNADHSDAVRLYATCLLGLADVDEATMTAIDEHTLTLEVIQKGTLRQFVLDLDAPIDTPSEARRVLIRMVERARAMADNAGGDVSELR